MAWRPASSTDVHTRDLVARPPAADAPAGAGVELADVDTGTHHARRLDEFEQVVVHRACQPILKSRNDGIGPFQPPSSLPSTSSSRTVAPRPPIVALGAGGFALGPGRPAQDAQRAPARAVRSGRGARSARGAGASGDGRLCARRALAPTAAGRFLARLVSPAGLTRRDRRRCSRAPASGRSASRYSRCSRRRRA